MKSPNLSPIPSNDVSSVASAQSAVSSLKTSVSENSLLDNNSLKNSGGLFTESFDDDAVSISTLKDSNNSLASGLEKPVGNQAKSTNGLNPTLAEQSQTSSIIFVPYQKASLPVSDVKIEVFDVQSQSSSALSVSEKNNTLAAKFKGYVKSLTQSTQDGLKKLGSLLIGLPQTLSNLPKISLNKQVVTQKLASVKNSAIQAGENVSNSIGALAASTYTNVAALGGKLGTFSKNATASLGAAIASGFQKAGAFLKSLGQKIQSGTKSAYQKTSNTVQKLVEKLKDDGETVEGFDIVSNPPSKFFKAKID